MKIIQNYKWTKALIWNFSLKKDRTTPELYLQKGRYSYQPLTELYANKYSDILAWARKDSFFLLFVY